MSNLFSAGETDIVKKVLQKLIAVRIYTRSTRVKDIAQEDLDSALKTSSLTPEIAEAIFHLTSKPTYEERFVIPPLARESGFEEIIDPFVQKAEGGFGTRQPPKRRY